MLNWSSVPTLTIWSAMGPRAGGGEDGTLLVTVTRKLVEEKFTVSGWLTLTAMLTCCAWRGVQLKVAGVAGGAVLVGVILAPGGAPLPRLQISGLVAVVVFVTVT
jgi:hypothetical protein